MAAEAEDPFIDLVLYVSAASPYAGAARRDCELLLARFDRSRVRFEVCDIAVHPDRAEADNICFTPTLLKRSPAPRTYVVGHLLNVNALVELLQASGLELLH